MAIKQLFTKKNIFGVMLLSGVALEPYTSFAQDTWAYLTGRYELVSVYDGDTITVRKSVIERLVDPSNKEVYRIRLFGIAAKELKENGGKQARNALRSLIGDSRYIKVKFTGARSFDRYVARTYVDGKSLGWLMVTAGHASISRRHAKTWDDLK